MNLGKLDNIYLGPMFSGKTSALIRYLTINADIGFKVLYINSSLDDRSEEDFSTHNSSNKGISNKITTLKTGYLKEVAIDKYDVIGIDEFQFYKDEKPSEIVRKWVLNGKRVSISSLDGDFNMRPFGDVFNLIPLCEAGGLFKMKEGICLECLKDNKFVTGSFTKKTKITKDEEVIEIGGKDKYKIVCLECHQKN